MKKSKILKRNILIGGCTGFLFGIFLFLMVPTILLPLFSYEARQFFYHTLGFPFVFAEGISENLNLCSELGCLLFNLIGGVLIYTLLGVLISLFISIYKNKKINK